MASISFGFSVRNVKSAHNPFSAITQTERMVDRTGNLWKKSLKKLRSEKALVHRLGLCSMNKDERSSQNVARKFLITNSKQLEQNKNAKFYKKNFGVSKRIFVKFINEILLRWRNYENSRVREVHQQNLTEMKELQKFQNSTFDELTRQKFSEDQNTIME